MRIESSGELRVERSGGELTSALERIVGKSAAFAATIARIPRIAESDVAVLVVGETGTGKELCARALHGLSPRGRGPFVAVNCGALPVELADNELFGHATGAYTNAATAQRGLLEAADGGTLFLDEVDSLPLAVQVKLLRVLQSLEYRRLGCAETHHVDLRIVAAMNSDPEEAIRAGRLRRDFYYRVNTVCLTLPPLRERRDDIPELARRFMAIHGGARRVLSAGALEVLEAYDWPGNVRELEAVVRRALILFDERELTAEHLELPHPVRTEYPSFQEAKARVVETFERAYLEDTLRRCGGNITQAAELAAKNRRAFFELLRKHGIDAGRYREHGDLIEDLPVAQPGQIRPSSGAPVIPAPYAPKREPRLAE